MEGADGQTGRAVNSASKSLQNGRIWLDGQLGASGLTSYNGHWEVISLQCGNNEGQTLDIGMDTIANGDGCGGELVPYQEFFKGEIAVGAGETLEISRVQGGAHAESELKKTGAGTLARAADQPYVSAKSNGDLVVKFGKRGVLIIFH